MRNFIKFILEKISRIIFYITPIEFRKKKATKSPLELLLEKDFTEETFNYFREHFKNSLIFENNKTIREYAIKTALLNDVNKEYYYLEFGVWKGATANFFSKFVKKIYCFDSFEGLNEDFVGTHLSKSHFNLNKKIPKLSSNAEVITGWVEDTLEDFLKKHSPKINFVHLDMDTYNSTKYTLEKIKPYLIKNANVWIS